MNFWVRIFGTKCLGNHQGLITFLDHAASQQFIEPEHRSMMLIDEHPESLLEKFMMYQPPAVDQAKWVLQMTNNNVKGPVLQR